MLRADALHELTASDIRELLGLGLRTVIDLRSSAETEAQPSTFAGHRSVIYHHVPLFDGLSPVNEQAKANKEFDLAARYIDAAEHCGPAITKVVRMIAQAEDGMVLFNCTAGKDRTGIVAAMLLALAGVPGDEIAADYALTASIAGPLMARLQMHAMARGLDELTSVKLLSSEPAVMMAFLNYMEGHHGGFAGYLSKDADVVDSIDAIQKRLIFG